MSWYCCGDGYGLLVLALVERLAQLAAQAAGEADQALRILGEIALADARLAIEAVQRGLRGDADQVAVALFVLGQHQQVVVSRRLGRLGAWSSALHT
jgi:hypothetical protein